MGPAHRHEDISAFAADALFVSALRCSDAPSAGQIRQAIDAAVREFGLSGCAGRVAQEFGDHPDAAVIRMRWARAAARSVFGAPVPEPCRTPDFAALRAALVARFTDPLAPASCCGMHNSHHRGRNTVLWAASVIKLTPRRAVGLGCGPKHPLRCTSFMIMGKSGQ
jgi:hypothetical protein